MVLIFMYQIIVVLYVNYISMYAMYLVSNLVSTILILASIDRLLISSRNIDTRLYSSRRLAYFSVSISVFVWVAFYIHALVKVDIYEIYSSIFHVLL